MRKGFVLIPDLTILKEAIELNHKLPNNELVLNAELARPHVTIVQTFFTPNFDYKKALQELRETPSFTTEVATLVNNVEVHNTSSQKGIVWWNLLNASWLKTLNRRVIEANEDFIVKPENPEIKKYWTPEQKESFLRTSYERNLDAYEPHITLGVSKNLENLSLGDVEKYSKASTGKRVRFHQLAFTENGKFGEITKVLDSVNLPISWDW